jgi:aminoglycoside phosphotransferase (APT) family kinase protein
MPGIPPEPTESQFAAVAKAIDPGAWVVSTRKLRGGMSCRKDVIELGAPSGQTLKIVIRQYPDHPDYVSDRLNHLESAVLTVLESNNIPASRMIVSEQVASELLGRPAIVISYLDGAAGVRLTDPQNWARQLAWSIANVHLVTVTDELRSILRPAFKEAQHWMSADTPPERFASYEHGVELWNAMKQMWPGVDTTARKLIHSDYWNGNTVWKGEKLLAITDSEMPALGDPMIDVGYILSDAEYIELDVEQTFIEAYEDITGKPVHDVLFWKMAAAARLLPDPDGWPLRQSDLGLPNMSLDERRHLHSRFFQNLLS